MKNIISILSLVLLSSCYNTLTIDGFEAEKWANYASNCSSYRAEIIDLVIKNQAILLGGTQNEIESLLGKAEEHELYQRNQKFFHYRLTPPDTCGKQETVEYLSIRFNAIGRVNLVQVMLRES